MSLLSLQLRPISISHYYVSGDVTIQEGVAIAPGVLIQADPDSCVVIKTGACIGIGAILHASKGVLEIGEGANIGAEVLLVGQVSIGRNACVGAASTILNSSVASGILIPSGSVVGDLSRPPDELQVDELQATETVFYPPAESAPPTEPPSPKTDPAQSPESTLVNNSDASAQSLNVYGQVYVNQLLVKMFPHHQVSQPPTSSTQLSNADDPWED
jgi:carbon dioxide concentrating mechanism protein CcmN